MYYIWYVNDFDGEWCYIPANTKEAAIRRYAIKREEATDPSDVHLMKQCTVVETKTYEIVD